MIRKETESGWILVAHADHAKLAGEFAEDWGNARFSVPEPRDNITYAVAHHDDGWIARDAAPTLTKDGKPEAFTRALVGAYSAFEEIDLPNYLRVRGEATQAVAAKNPYAGIVVSMHTVNLLTEQADLSTIRPEHRPSFDAFVEGQRVWQRETAAKLGAAAPELQRAFEFLQCCDNLSLIACSGYDTPRELRHTHPDRDGQRHTLVCTPTGEARWSISPWPFAEKVRTYRLPYREVPYAACSSVEALRDAFHRATPKLKIITLEAPM